jgi:hypothetical protein
LDFEVGGSKQSKAKQCIALLAKHIMQSHNLGENKTLLKGLYEYRYVRIYKISMAHINWMSKETIKEEFKEETHEVQDEKQEELDEEDVDEARREEIKEETHEVQDEKQEELDEDVDEED